MLNMGRNFCFVNISAKNGSRALTKIMHMCLIKFHQNVQFGGDPDLDPDLTIKKPVKSRPSLKGDRGVIFEDIALSFGLSGLNHNLSNISNVFSFLICRSLTISDETRVKSDPEENLQSHLSRKRLEIEQK